MTDTANEQANEDLADTVVVGVDGSDCSMRAVQWAQDYARLTHTRLRIVSAWDLVVGYGPFITVPPDDMKALAQDVLDKARATVDVPDDRVETCLVRGQAGPTLAQQSKGAALLVVGSSGHNPVAAALLGSASTYCAHHTACPVTIVR